MGREPWTRGPILPLVPPPPQQQFLDDPKYSSDEDLLSKLEAFKSEGKTVGGRGGGSEEGRITPRTEKRQQRHKIYICGGKKGGCPYCPPSCRPFPWAALPSTLSVSLHFNRAPLPDPHFLRLPYLLLSHLPHLGLG